MIDAPQPELPWHRDGALDGLHILEQPVPRARLAPDAELGRVQLHAVDQNGPTDDGAVNHGRVVGQHETGHPDALSEAEPLCGGDSRAAGMDSDAPAVAGLPRAVLDPLASVHYSPGPPGLQCEPPRWQFGDVVHGLSLSDPDRGVGAAAVNRPQMWMTRIGELR